MFNEVTLCSEANSTGIAAKWSFDVLDINVKRQLAGTGKSLCLSFVPVKIKVNKLCHFVEKLNLDFSTQYLELT